MKLIILLFSLLISLNAQTEFLVNTHTDTTQRSPVIARDAAGNYVIVWKSLNQVSPTSQGDIFLQRFNSSDQKIGTETLVNTETNFNQEYPAVAMNAAGNFVVTWASYSNFSSIYDIKAKLFVNNVGGAEILVNTTTINSQQNPVVDIRDNGEFIIAWDSWFQDGSDRGVFAQRFDAVGNKIGNEFRVNTRSLYSQAKPRLKYFTDGSFIVIWESWKQDIVTPSGYGLYGKIFNADGSEKVEEFRINTFTNDYQWFGDVEAFYDNTFAVVWCSWEQDGDDGGIYFQRFDELGNKTGLETRINQTTLYYQWLPKIRKLPSHKNVAIVWSSWKQDGDREGVFAAFVNENNELISLETQVNDYTSSFQWEPDFVALSDTELLVTWSSWQQMGNDYNIIAKPFTPILPAGYLNPEQNVHLNGRSSTKIKVHVVDQQQANNHTYRVTFDTGATSTQFLATIKDMNTNVVKVQNYPLIRGENVFYNTPIFDGLTVEFQPKFSLLFAPEISFFKQTSNTNLSFTYSLATAGVKKLAPIDVALVWGNCDTLPNGQYANPLDTALGINGVREIVVPFYAWNITDNQKITILIKELSTSRNKKWDPQEEIIFITPPQYQSQSNNTHAQINPIVPSSNIILPGIGDTNFVFTIKPLTTDDIFEFTFDTSFLLDSKTNDNNISNNFVLKQNYPNPFNPYTTIKFYLNESSQIELIIYDILGREIIKLINGFIEKGEHKILFDGSNLSSGVYFYMLRRGENSTVNKMLLIK